jgi:hypothetical protein
LDQIMILTCLYVLVKVLMARGKEQYQVRKEAHTVTIVVVSQGTTTIMDISP